MWRKSSRSDSSSCVEVRHDLGAIRDSKQPDGPRLALTQLTSFIQGVKDGRFDRD